MSTVSPPSAPPEPSPRSSAKEARAEARAAKAKAKALRPWYRKKRFILLVLIAAVIIIVVAANSGSKDSNSLSTQSTVAGVSQGGGSANASADVSSASLGQPDSLGFRSVTLTVTNHSSKRSNYLIEMSIESPDGKTRYDTSTAFVNNLEANQTTTPDAIPVTKTVPDDAVVKIKTVTRLASN